MSTDGKQDKRRGRPPRPLPVIEATPEELAKAMINLPADHKWQYEVRDEQRPNLPARPTPQPREPLSAPGRDSPPDPTPPATRPPPDRDTEKRNA